MLAPIKTLLYCVLMTFSCLFVFELLVEARQYSRGFDTLILGRRVSLPQYAAVTGSIGEYGPNNEFPFRSRVVGEKKAEGKLRIWVASASYAEASDIAVSQSFANLLCEQQMPAPFTACESLNGSKASWTVVENTHQVDDQGPRWRPDYVLLYEASNDIEFYSGAFLAGHVRLWNFDNGIFDALRTNLNTLFERTSLYSHLRHFVGGSILLSSQLADQLPNGAANDFKSRLEAFIKSCRSINAKPVLITFVARNDISTADKIPMDLKFQLLRYNGKLSPAGWCISIDKLNEVIRQVGKENGILVLDLAKTFERRPEYFKDFFHFTPLGHQEVARTLANLMSEQFADTSVVHKNGL